MKKRRKKRRKERYYLLYERKEYLLGSAQRKEITYYKRGMIFLEFLIKRDRVLDIYIVITGFLKHLTLWVFVL